MTRIQIEEREHIEICFEGVSRNGDDWLVLGTDHGDNLYMILRNQGEHDRNFFVVKIVNGLDEAIAKAKYFCNR